MPRIAGRRVAPSVVPLAFASAALLVAASCAPVDESAGSDGSGSADDTTTANGAGDEADPLAECTPDDLETLQPGTLTIATGQPAYEPWIVGNEPENGEGFEGAVAYAVAERLGYADEDVAWTRVDFNAAIQPGPKDFDFDINQFSITDERKQAVDFSSSYYDVTQAVVALEDGPAADASGLADLRDIQLGAQVGTTSLQVIEEVIDPSTDPQVYNTNDDAKLALSNGQIDGLVVDLPTAFFITSAELDDGVIVGQLPQVDGEVEQFGLLLDKDSSLTTCVSAAVDALRADGTLDAIADEWLADAASAPELS